MMTAFDQVRKVISAVLSILLLTAICAVVLEAGSFFVLRRVVTFHTWKVHPAERMAAYRQPWGRDFWREQREVIDAHYQPFLQRRTKPFSGKTIHVDDAGIRRTLNPRCEAGAPLIWMFGGSTMWGFGNPDWTTIPSVVAADYARRGKAACIVNYGEDSWTTTQGVIKLMLELKSAKRSPDVVVFLNGCNDIFTPYKMTGDPALEYDYVRYRRALDQLLTADRGSWGWLRLTNTATLFTILRRIKGGIRDAPPTDPATLARRIAHDYFGNLRVVDGLSAAYRFRPVYYWQPLSVYGSKEFTQEEIRAMNVQTRMYRDDADSAARVVPIIRSTAAPHFHFLGNLFDGRRDSLYIDACHLQPAGNAVIARVIADDLLSATSF